MAYGLARIAASFVCVGMGYLALEYGSGWATAASVFAFIALCLGGESK